MVRGVSLTPTSLQLLAEVVVRDPDGRALVAGGLRRGRGRAGLGSDRRPVHYRGTSVRLLGLDEIGSGAGCARREPRPGPPDDGYAGRGAGRHRPRHAAGRLLLLFELDVDHVVGLAGRRPAVGRGPAPPGPPRRRAAAAAGVGGVEVLGHRLAGPAARSSTAWLIAAASSPFLASLTFSIAARTADLSASDELVLVLVDQLLELVDPLLGRVAGLGQLALLLVLGGVGLGVALHPLDLVLRQAAGRLDLDRLLLAGPLVAGRDVEDAVGVDVERRPRSAACPSRRRRDAFEVELAEQAVVARPSAARPGRP